MKKLIKIISYLSLALIILAPSLFYAGAIDLAMNKQLLIIATIIWFISATFWIGSKCND